VTAPSLFNAGAREKLSRSAAKSVQRGDRATAAEHGVGAEVNSMTRVFSLTMAWVPGSPIDALSVSAGIHTTRVENHL
jgi:hypothetical protein